MFFARRLPREEVYVTFSYGPILGDDGRAVEGVFCACAETTGRVLGERRLSTLRDLGLHTSGSHTVEAACRAAAEVLDAFHPSVQPPGPQRPWRMPWTLAPPQSSHRPHTGGGARSRCRHAWRRRMPRLKREVRPRRRLRGCRSGAFFRPAWRRGPRPTSRSRPPRTGPAP